jgi:NAD(P)-dependent dehydrogenase (short-subunit alcohol dehydrogenase family)
MAGDRLDFAGRVAVVTGAGRGLGRAYAELLASRGAAVLVNDVGCDPKGGGASGQFAQETVEAIRAAGGRAAADATDVSAPDAAARIVEAALAAFGRLDVLINNAGIVVGGPFGDLPAADFDAVMDVGLGAAIRLSRAAWPHLAASGAGRIVNVTSHSVFGLAGSAPYIVSKTAAIGLTKALAFDGQPLGIRVNCVMPGAFTRLTAQIPPGPLLDFVKAKMTPERVAPLVVALCHEAVPCTGEVFHAGAGLYSRIRIAAGPGLAAPDAAPADLLGAFDAIMSDAPLTPAASTDEIMRFVFSRVAE